MYVIGDRAKCRLGSVMEQQEPTRECEFVVPLGTRRLAIALQRFRKEHPLPDFASHFVRHPFTPLVLVLGRKAPQCALARAGAQQATCMSRMPGLVNRAVRRSGTCQRE
jgi:hypothetical protein